MCQLLCSPYLYLGWNFKAPFHTFKVESESFVLEQGLERFLGLPVCPTLDQSDNPLTHLKPNQTQPAGKLRGELIQTLGHPTDDLPQLLVAEVIERQAGYQRV